MKTHSVLRAAYIVSFAVATWLARADDKVNPADFANTNGKLGENDLIEFLIFRFDVPLNKIVQKPYSIPTIAEKKEAVSDNLSAVVASAGHEPPLTVGEVNSWILGWKAPAKKPAEMPAWQKVPAILEPVVDRTIEYFPTNQPAFKKRFRGTEGQVKKEKEEFEKGPGIKDSDKVSRRTVTYGPFRLRRNVGSMTDTFVETEHVTDENALATVEGAKIGYSNNFDLAGNGAFNTEGALIWSVRGIFEPEGSGDFLVHAGLATSWNVQEQEKPDTADINELKFGIPVATLLQGKWLPGSESQMLLLAEPYYQSDTRFDGDIIGITVSAEYRNRHFGNYRNWTKIGRRNLDWRLRGLALADFSDVHQSSAFMKRTVDDDWTRFGAETGLELGLFDYSGESKLPVVLGLSYRFFQTVSGDGGYADLLKANLTFWLNAYMAASVEYQRGETPVANKDIDLLTVGFQLRY
jgi:hypothetical protein